MKTEQCVARYGCDLGRLASSLIGYYPREDADRDRRIVIGHFTELLSIIMLTRRQLLTRGTTLLVLVPILGCSSSDGDGTPDGTCAGVSTTSTVDAQHTHTLCVLTTDLTTPLAGGVTYTTSVDGSHSHKVVLTQADLTSINAGQTVTVTSSNDVDPINNALHMHGFSIKKA